jgi:hypothetical protein
MSPGQRELDDVAGNLRRLRVLGCHSPSTRRRCSSRILVRQKQQRGNEAVTAAVVLVAVTTRAAPGRACARRLRGAAAEAPGPSQGRLSGLSASGRCHVSTRLD